MTHMNDLSNTNYSDASESRHYPDLNPSDSLQELESYLLGKSMQINELAKALIKAQLEFNPAIKDAKNTFFKNNYLSLEGVIASTRKQLANNGLCVIQMSDIHEGETILETYLVHESGQFIKGRYSIAPVKNDPQGNGSAMTYARRYTYMAAVGLVAEDDDGESAQGRAVTTHSPSFLKKEPAQPAVWSEAQKAVAKRLKEQLLVKGEGYKFTFDRYEPADMALLRMETMVEEYNQQQVAKKG